MEKPAKRSLRFGIRLNKADKDMKKGNEAFDSHCPNCNGQLIEGNLCLSCKERVKTKDIYDIARISTQEIKVDWDKVNELTSEYKYKKGKKFDLKTAVSDVWDSTKNQANEILLVVVFLVVIMLAAFLGIYLQKILY